MPFLWIALGAVAFILLLSLLIAYICYRRIFYSPNRTGECRLPVGEVYEKYHPQMSDYIERAKKLPHTDVQITSFDSLTLRGKYFEYAKDAPIEIMFHGYRGSAERDMSGGVFRAFAVGHSALIVDQRACGRSDGKVISFGANESRDCLKWIEFVNKSIDSKAKIILTGVSMGAATVMICAGQELPDNVIGVLADCGYTAPSDIIKKVMRDMHLPANLLYPFARLGARLFGRFELEAKKPIDAIKKCTLPIIFYHGDQDDFVPYEMSKRNFDTCSSEYKRLITIEGAAHALCYITSKEKYENTLRDFFAPIE